MGNHAISFPTWECGLGCPYCGYKVQEDKQSVFWRPSGKVYKVENELSGKDWLRLLLPFKADLYDFCGGEPLRHPGFAEITHGLPVWAITSNTLGDVKNLNFRNCKSWTASFHPHVARDTQKLFCEHIKFIRAHGVDVAVTMVATPNNVDKVIARCDQFVRDGYHCNIHPYYDEPGFSWDNYPEEWRKLIRCQYTRYDIKLKSWNGGGVAGKDKKCEGGHTYFSIAPDGKIFTCLWRMFIDQESALPGPQLTSRKCSIRCQIPCDFIWGLGVKST